MIRVGILGYGNLGRGVESALSNAKDMQLVGVFTRRKSGVNIATPNVGVYPAAELANFADKIDVLIICGGSATDLPVMTPEYARYFNVVDSFDTHNNIPAHFAAVDAAASANGHTAMISTGWDPGLFSINRVYADSILPDGATYTFWGKGVSQGHSDAVRRIEGVLDARQYTIPREEAMAAVRSGIRPDLKTGDKHLRECFVVAAEGADRARIEKEIVTMPNYFDEYQTTVHFITAEEMRRDHSGMPHGGFVIRTGNTGNNGEYKNVIEYSLKLDSNPYFTAGVLVASARAIYRMNQRGVYGCKTILDVAPADLSPLSPEELRKHML